MMSCFLLASSPFDLAPVAKRFLVLGEEKMDYRRRIPESLLPAHVGVASLTVVLLAAFGVAGDASAQETGRVAGTVVDADTGTPLQGAQVSVEGTGLGSLTGAEGEYSIREVPAGEQTVVVQLIGYGSDRATVTVTAGQTATADFELSEQALALDEIVVTGTAGGQQRRAIGNVVESLRTDEILDDAPVQNMQELLGQRTAGLM